MAVDLLGTGNETCSDYGVEQTGETEQESKKKV